MGTAVDFGARQKEAEQSGLLGSGDYLKLKEGANRFRLMSECLPHASTFNGESNFKWLCYVVDRKDAKVKPFFMPHTIYKQIAALQTSEDYPFAEVPMPYDLTITAIGAGQKTVKYTLIPARKETPITAVEYQELAAAKPLKDLQAKLREKDAQKVSTGQPPPTHEDEPFAFDENGDPI